MTVATTPTVATAKSPRRARKTVVVATKSELPKVVAPQGALSEALGRMAVIAPQKPSMPVLANVLLIAGDEMLTLAATNIAVGVFETIHGIAVAGEATLTVPARLLADLIKTLEGEISLSFDLERDTLIVEAAGFHTEIKGIAADEFPQLPSLGDSALATVEGALLREAIKAVAGAADDALDAGNQFANVRLWLRGSQLVADAADGAVIARHVVPLNGATAADTEILIPAVFLRSFVNLIGGTVEIQANTNLVGFSTDAFTIVAQQSATPFVAVERVMTGLPAPDLTAEGETEALLKGIRRALMFAPTNQSHMLTLTLTDDNEQPTLRLHTQSTTGAHNGAVPLAAVAGHTELLVNGVVLVDALKAVGSPTVIIERSSSYPGLRLRRPDRPGSCQIVAPLKML